MGKAIGIDLGTTNSASAYYEKDRVKILTTRMNESLTPSVVSYKKKKKNDLGMILVGRAAVNNALLQPQNTIYSIKRLMGLTIDDPKVEKAKKNLSYSIVEDDDTENRGLRVLINNTKYSAIDISSMILKQIKEDAELSLGEEVTHAVITVPAYFEERQRSATREAGIKAGLIVKKIVDEPTAAAVAFGIERSDENHRVLVYDMGGGTFDISLIQMVNKQYQTLATGGDMWLGGDDLDNQIIQSIIEWIKTEYDGFDASENERFMALAKQKAEETKKYLTAQDEYDLQVPGAISIPDEGLVDIDMVITREDFNAKIQQFVDRSMDIVRKTMKEQNMTNDDITEVLMVGGSTAVPLVFDTVVQMFGEEKVKRHIDPMQCVAYGAGILASKIKSIECPKCNTENSENAKECKKCKYIIADIKPKGEVGLGEVTSKSLGICVVKNDMPDCYAIIIPKGTQYPLNRPIEQTFYTTTDNIINVPVYEGEDQIAVKNDLQGVVEYKLPENVPTGTPVSVKFDYDQDRVLKVSVRVQGYDNLQIEKTLSRDRAIADFERREEEEEKWRENLENIQNAAAQFLNQYRTYMDDGAAKKMASDIEKAKRAYEQKDKNEGTRVMQTLQRGITGSGIASQLFIAENSMDGLESDQVGLIRNAIKKLRSAHEQKNNSEANKISNALNIALSKIHQQRQNQTEIGDKDFGGLLTQQD